MSLRLRLGLWYSGLTELVVLLVGLFLYAAHTRGHYDDLDYTLQTTAAHMAPSTVRSSSRVCLMFANSILRARHC